VDMVPFFFFKKRREYLGAGHVHIFSNLWVSFFYLPAERDGGCEGFTRRLAGIRNLMTWTPSERGGEKK